MAESNDKESVVIKDESSPLGIFLVKSGSKGDRLLFRYPYELTDNQSNQQSDDKDEHNKPTSYDSCDSSSRRLTSSVSSMISSSSNFNLNSCYLSTQIEKKKNPYALVEDNNGIMFAHNSGFNATGAPGTNAAVKTPTATFGNDPFFKLNTATQFGNKNSNLQQPKFTSFNSNKIDSCLLNVINLPDKILCDLLAVKSDLCGNKFELKINDVRFVGHPVLLSSKNNFQASTSNGDKTHGNKSDNKDLEKDLVTFNVVFALRANASQEIVKCYYDCSKRIAIALHFEEQRVGYLTSEKEVMTAHDENQDNEQIPYSVILEKSTLAKTLKKMYEDLSTYGALYLRINSWIEVSFCLPQKVHKLTLKYHEKIPLIDPSEIQKSLESLRPYHGILLLVDPRDLFDTLPLDAAPALIRVIRVISPVKNLLDLSADADISLKQVFHIVAQLVYWAKATITYPFCDNNVYMINPLAPVAVDSQLVKKFEKEFHKSDLLQLLSDFSFGVSISHLRNPMMMDTDQQAQLIHKVIWLLKHRLLLQIHTYVYLMIPLSNSTVPYLTKKVNNFSTLSGKNNHHNTSNDSSSASYDLKNLRISTETNEHLDISVESGSSFSENDSLDTSPINFNTNNMNTATTSTTNLNVTTVAISNSYPLNSYINSSYQSNRFDINNSLSTKKLHRSSLNIAPSESKMNAEVIINRHAMLQQQTQHLHKKEHKPQLTTNDQLGAIDSIRNGLDRNGSLVTNSMIKNGTLKKSNNLTEDTEEEDEISIEDNYLGMIEENRLEMLKELGLSKAECECILSIPASQNFDDLRLFVRLCPYFNGRHHLEDIMYYANVRRSALLALIDKFRDVLYTAQYEDESVAHLCPYSQNC